MTLCISCGAPLEPEKIKSEFKCPYCAKPDSVIGRCTRCKKLSREYTCKMCGQKGP